MKTCFKCGVEKKLSNFYKHKEMKDGYLNKCKECTKSDSRSNRDKNIEYYRAYDNERSKSEKRMKANIEQVKKYRGKYTNKYLAHNMVNNAIRNSKIVKPLQCEKCKEKTNLHGHHDDYAKPLEVRWLCVPCHSHWHKVNGEAKNG